MGKKYQLFRHTFIVTAFTVMMLPFLTSCFGDEPKGCEADIETAILHVDNPEQFFFQATDSMKVVFSTDSVIAFTVRSMPT